MQKGLSLQGIRHANQITKVMSYKKDEMPYTTKFITYEKQTNLNKQYPY